MKRAVIQRIMFLSLTCCILAFSLACPSARHARTATGASESFTLRVRVAGLIGLVPDADGDVLGALMVDAPAPATASNGCVVPRHFPQINWKAGTCEGDPEDCDKSVLNLKHEDVLLRVVGGETSAPPPLLKLGDLPYPAMRPPQPSPVPPIDPSSKLPALGPEWALHVEELYTGEKALKLKDGCLRPVPSVDCPVVARLALDRGAVQTCRLSEIETLDSQGNVTYETWTYDFRALADGSAPRKGPSPRTFTTVTEVVWQGEGTGLEIEVVPFGTPKASRLLKLTPDSDREIILDFVNVPRQHGHPKPDSKCDARMKDFHFERIYSLVTQWPDTRYVPHTVSRVEDAQPDCHLLRGTTPHLGGPMPPGVGACIKMVLSSHPKVEQLLAIPTVE